MIFVSFEHIYTSNNIHMYESNDKPKNTTILKGNKKEGNVGM
jgi:hypothetical protein